MMTPAEIDNIEAMAAKNDGHCDHCGQMIKIYRHKPNKAHVKILRRLQSEVRKTGVNKFNFNDIEGSFAQKSQRSKMRQHGLIAKFKEDGKHVANTWVITTKGYDFLAGNPIQQTVVVYDNQVIGHDGPMVTIRDIAEEPDFEADNITEPESKLYHDVRTPQRDKKVMAIYTSRNYSNYFKKDQPYEITIKRMVMGKPVIISSPQWVEYSDIGAFQKAWKIIDGGNNENNK